MEPVQVQGRRRRDRCVDGPRVYCLAVAEDGAYTAVPA